MANAIFDRFDLTQAQVDLANYAVKIDVVDPIGLIETFSVSSFDFETVRDNLSNYAFTNIHTRPEVHVAWCKANDAYSAALYLMSA